MTIIVDIIFCFALKIYIILKGFKNVKIKSKELNKKCHEENLKLQ
jgi:hypothetical protein